MFEGLFLLLKDMLLFSSHVNLTNSYPKPLSQEKESEYIDRVEKGDKEARDILVRHNLRLVVHVVKKYSNYPDTDELISVGSIGLIKAVSSFSKQKGTQFATYAARCIENEILMTLRAGKKRRGDVSLYDAIGVDKEGNEITLIDMLHTDEDSIFSSVEKSIVKEKIDKLTTSTLDKRELEIIRLRYGLGDVKPLTQREVARIYGISRSYVSRIEKKALEKLKIACKREKIYC